MLTNVRALGGASIVALLTVLILIAVAGCTSDPPLASGESYGHTSILTGDGAEAATPVSKVAVEIQPIDLANEPIQPVPTAKEVFEELELDWIDARITLGRRLFHDASLSKDSTLSCAGCHDLRYAGIDRAVTATGVAGAVGPVNTPTVFNSVFSVDQFWDGRADDLEAQAGGPVVAEGEMAGNWDTILTRLRKDESYVEAFRAAFPDDDFPDVSAIGRNHVLNAIAHFECTLVTPNSPFDRYLQGDESAISTAAKEGYQLFKDIGCTDCHYGIAVGGKTYQRLGAKREFFRESARISHVDMGRFNVTKDERDLYVFKVPNLRNIELTGPYFHDGSVRTLWQAVILMANHQLDYPISSAETDRIVEFLRTLDGEFEGNALQDIMNLTREQE